MAEPKTVPTDASVDDFIDAVPDEAKRADARRVMEIMREVTGEEPVMWGPSIVGFGSHRYVYESGRQGDWPVAAFSPRKTALTIYLLADFAGKHASLLEKLGPHKLGKGCLYLKRLSDVDESALRTLILRSMPVEKGGSA